eukprot:TRINITY_DN5964_c0_g1_i1.p1 TRINITY_DN5964_c0_g1~~TRINITY_DN5964_c0_g1_i1.p1  ORF type:complete len:205 (+),score=56.81 TRINITY_DN5964_c0_g1_i1:163-777(+)
MALEDDGKPLLTDSKQQQQQKEQHASRSPSPLPYQRQPEEGRGRGEDDEEGDEESTFRIRLMNPRLFLTKTIVIIAASYAFIPLIALFNEGEISAVLFAIILVALHLFFIVIYLYRVRYRELDGDWKSLAYRLLGLIACIGLLFLVAGTLSENLWVLAAELAALCVVHTFILSLLMVEVRLPGSSSTGLFAKKDAVREDGSVQV